MSCMAGVQRIVLHGGAWKCGRQLVLMFPPNCAALHFLSCLQKQLPLTTHAQAEAPQLQVSLGFSRRGLEQLRVPQHVLSAFALKAPAFWAGAAQRASRHLGAFGLDGSPLWDGAFAEQRLHAVLSLQAQDAELLGHALKDLEQLAKTCGVKINADLPPLKQLAAPVEQAGSPVQGAGQWVHFGFRDGVSRVGIEGLSKQRYLKDLLPGSIHLPGEFVLGYPQSNASNPWIVGPGKRVWPEVFRAFFRDGSFGVLQQIEQRVQAFESFVSKRASQLELAPEDLKAKLCGRRPDGLSLAAPANAQPEADFDYAADPKGHACPFGSHVRRMNPRGDGLAHSGRARPLLRRGLPYGPEWRGQPDDGSPARGLMAHFFCASIEDQFEHLVGQWADRVPMGSKDRGRARDPLMGAHQAGDGSFEIPRDGNRDALWLQGLEPFTRTRGIAYLFYPSLSTLDGIAKSIWWGAGKQDDDK